MRILGIERDNRACNYYRIFNPLKHIEEQGLADVVLLPYGEPLDGEDAINKVFETDIILLPRPSSEEWFKFVKAARKAGKIIVADYDDDPFNCSPFNPYYRWIGIQEWQHPEYGWVWKDQMRDGNGEEWFNIEKNINRRDMLRAAFKRADMVSTTTPVLQDTFKKINPNTVVLPNLIDLDYYPRPEMVKRKVRIGWQGGVSHYEDLHFIKDVIVEVSKRDDVELVYFGDYRLAQLLRGSRNVQIESWVEHGTYPYKLALMNLDIGICPLVDNTFNRNKSPIKYFEYSAVGAATIASDIPPYTSVINSGKDGLLVPNNHKDWLEALNTLIQDKSRRQNMAKAAYENVFENYTIQKGAHLWVDAYKELIEKESVLT